MIGFGIIVVDLKAGSAPGALLKKQSHMTYTVDVDREAFAPNELTSDSIKQAKQYGNALYSAASVKPLGVTKSQLDDQISRAKSKLHEKNLEVGFVEDRIRRSNEMIVEFEQKIETQKGKICKEEEVLRKRKLARDEAATTLNNLVAERDRR